MTKQNYIFIALFVAVLILALALGCSFMINANAKANADYQDIVNDNTALVNFNQYINFTLSASSQLVSIVNGQSVNIPNTLNQNVYCNVQIPFESGHTYYFYTNNYSRSVEITNDSGSPYITLSSQYVIFTSGGTATGTRFYFLGGMDAGTYSFSYIDLTQMFGVGNEPNLEQAQELFVSYYSYNTGSAVSLSGLNSYAQGYNDASSSYTTITTSYDSYAQIFDAGASYFVKQANNNGTSFTGRVGFYLGFTAQASTSLDISLNYFLVHNTADLQIGYVTNGSFVPLFSGIRDVWSPHSSGLGYTAKIHITLPVAVSYLYLYSNVSSVSDNPACILGSYEITYTAYDYQSAVIDAENNGYSRAENLYKPQLESYTNENGTGYQNIYNDGYQDGLNAQVSEARKKTYTFTNFLGALFDVPVTTLKSLLDFNFLGFNLKNFVFSLLTLSIVFAIIKLILVKTGDSK